MPERPRLLDLYCGAGGAAVGYARAGFAVTGVDISPQPRYPFAFVQADALAYVAAHGHEYDAIHASPPCQRWSAMTARHGAERSALHPSLIAPTREALAASGAPYVIENVPGARLELRDPLMLCGSMFALRAGAYGLRRHRLFEASVWIWPPTACAHTGPALPVYGHAGGSSLRDGLTFPGVAAWREGMGIDYMTGAELAEAIPPAFTEYIGAALLAALRA